MSIYYNIDGYDGLGVILFCVPQSSYLKIQFMRPASILNPIHEYEFNLNGLVRAAYLKIPKLFYELHVGTPTLTSLLNIRLDPKNKAGIKRFGERLRKVIELYCALNLPSVTEVLYVHRD